MKSRIAILVVAATVAVLSVSFVYGEVKYKIGWIDKCLQSTKHLDGSGQSACECMYKKHDSALTEREILFTTGTCLGYTPGA